MGRIPTGDEQRGAHHFPIVSLNKNQKQTLAEQIFGSKLEWFAIIVDRLSVYLVGLHLGDCADERNYLLERTNAHS